VQAGSSKTEAIGIFLDLPNSLLSHLVQMTSLQLGSAQVQSDAALQHVTALSALQHLDLALRGCGLQIPTAAVLTGLQHLKHVTALKLRAAMWPIDLHSMPALTALTALRVLSLSGCVSVDPAVLAGICQLQELDLLCSHTWDAESSAQMLAAIGQQPQLTLLRLHLYRFWSAASAAAYSALTASSHLQHLELQNCGFPDGAWQHVFPRTRCLPELHYLSASSDDYGVRRQELSPADVQAMVSCCPALASLRLGPQLAVPTTAPLGVLTGLKRLCLHASLQDNAPSLAELTGLQLLVINSTKPGEQVTVSGLLQLTVLRLLQHMAVMGCVYDPGLATSREAYEEPWLNIENKVRMSAAASGSCLQFSAAQSVRSCEGLAAIHLPRSRRLLCWCVSHQTWTYKLTGHVHCIGWRPLRTALLFVSLASMPIPLTPEASHAGWWPMSVFMPRIYCALCRQRKHKRDCLHL